MQVLPHHPCFNVSERWYPGQRWDQYSIVMLNLKRTPLVGGRDRCLLCPVVTGALCLQMVDDHLLIPGVWEQQYFHSLCCPPPAPHPAGGALRPGPAEPGSGFRKEEVHLYLCLSLRGRGEGERTLDLSEMAVCW